MSGSCELLASVSLQEDASAIGGIELSLKFSQVHHRGFGVDSGGLFGADVPPGAGFGEAGGGAGGWVSGDVAQRVGCLVGGPAAAADRQVECSQQMSW
ncbi:MAG: hypothetical protein H0V69_11000 [Acidimicrobiia bacterium]|nr:hypothetical protein [Acidimicrobiia bacterium]